MRSPQPVVGVCDRCVGWNRIGWERQAAVRRCQSPPLADDSRTLPKRRRQRGRQGLSLKQPRGSLTGARDSPPTPRKKRPLGPPQVRAALCRQRERIRPHARASPPPPARRGADLRSGLAPRRVCVGRGACLGAHPARAQRSTRLAPGRPAALGASPPPARGTAVTMGRVGGGGPLSAVDAADRPPSGGGGGKSARTVLAP